jgi:hypothetical protein
VTPTISTDEALALDAGTYLKGIPTGTEHEFMSVATFQKLQRVMTDPVELQNSAKHRGFNAEILDEETLVHDLIQRALTGTKKANVSRYADYIEGVILRGEVGVLPPMHLWTSEPLEVVTSGSLQYLLVPDGIHLQAIDGETQLAGHFVLYGRLSAEERKIHGAYPLQQVVHHGLGVTAAQKYFHDLNVLAVRPNVSLSLAMDSTDALMGVVKEVEAKVGFVSGRVERQARQLPKSSPRVITTQSLRQMVINVMKGIGGVQYGARAVPTEGVDLRQLREAAVIWLSAYFNAFGMPAVVDREQYLAGSPAVLAAVGAMGQKVFEAEADDRDAVAERLIATLRSVNWKKGEHWVGIAGSMKVKGFSVSGTKEAAYAIHNVLTDPANAGYNQIRTSVSTASVTPTAPAHEPAFEQVRPEIVESTMAEIS